MKLQLGALDIETNKYILPCNANKSKEYKCIDCNKRVILKKGSIRIPYFSHYVKTHCLYYDHPNEAQIHKDATMLMAQLLRNKNKILFTWKCKSCNGFYGLDNYEYNIYYKDGDEVITEYRSKDGKWIADIAIVNNNEVRYIIEIKNTHTTVSYRPEPWFEVNAEEFIKNINENILDNNEYNDTERKTNKDHVDEYLYRIPCIRNIDRYCYGSFCEKEKWIRKIPKYDESLIDNKCILCKKDSSYEHCCINNPHLQFDKFRVCVECIWLDAFHKKLRDIYDNPKLNQNVISENELLSKIPKLMSRTGMTQGWRQEVSCISCCRAAYSPVYENKEYYAICKICLADPQSRIITEKNIKEKNISNETKCMIQFK